MKQGVIYSQNGFNTAENLTLNDTSDKYQAERGYQSSVSWFENRIEDAVDEDRLLPDESAVISTALRIGLCYIESSELDAMDLTHQVWLETGKKERLKKDIIESLSELIDRRSVEEGFDEFKLGELVEIHRKFRETY